MQYEYKFDLENVAYWYFRLNGCLTIPNFVVHPDIGRNQETDVDVIAVRFPFRAENLVNPMKDDNFFTIESQRVSLFLSEVKTGRCNLNGPWTKPSRKNMQRVLSAVGIVRQDLVDIVATQLYNFGFYKDSLLAISLFCIGAEKNEDILERYKNIPQVTWEQTAEFIYNRFRKHRNTKVSHNQWDETGQKLWDYSMRYDLEHFKK